jgi:putative DNA primase/helicase
VNIDVDALKASVDLVSLVGAYTTLRKRGKEYVGLCVAHADKNPSMWVNGDKGIVHCFACDFHADAIDFIQHVEGLDFKAACVRLGAKTDWQPRIAQPKPAAKPERITSKPPLEAPTPNMVLRGLGEPSRLWPYKDADGSLIGYVARYEAPDGKQIRCWSWGQRGDEPHAWGCGAWSKPRPLYGLDRLEARRGAPVLIVEGEKAADAAQEKLGQYVVVTWPGGANAWKHADYEALRGRRVDLWPDNDEPGIEAMQSLKAILADPRGLACYGKIIDPNRMPDGYDAADWTGSSAELIDWLRERATEYPEKPAPQEPTEGGEDRREPADAGPPPETVPPAPHKRKLRLAVVGNTALAPEEDAAPLPQAMSEDAIADHFCSEQAAKWRYVKAWGTWFEWQGDGWHRDDTAKIDRLAVEVTRQAIYWADAQTLTPDAKRRINSRRTAGSVRDLALSDRRIAGTADQWDRDPWLLGVPGGAVDLRIGKLIAARPEDYITKRTAISPEAGDCRNWMSLLDRVTSADATMLDYLQRLCGYVLTGETREECFAFVYGPAQTGKSTFIRVLSEILGDYHCKASMETFTESRHERHAEELAVLVGARLVTAVETEEGKRWNESRIKALTGRDRIRARFMRENSFEFDPQFKLIIAGNHAPHLRNVDEAMRRRLHIIPFTAPIPSEERDDTLADKLRAEYPQILQWMIHGTLAWIDAKLGRPEQIAQAVDNYLESEDTFGEWLSECTQRDPQGKCLSGGAYKAYKNWADTAGEHGMSQKRFVQALRERGFDPKRLNGKRYIGGLSLKETEGPPYMPYRDN